MLPVRQSWSYDRLRLADLISMEISSRQQSVDQRCHQMHRFLTLSCNFLPNNLHPVYLIIMEHYNRGRSLSMRDKVYRSIGVIQYIDRV